jgi:hypothetical protein
VAAGEDRYEALVGTVLLAATPDAPEVPGEWTLVERDVLSVLMEEDERGLLTPVFTSPEALARWRPEGGCFAERDAAWHFGLAAGDPEGRVVVDPGSPSSVVLAPAEVAALAEGRSPAAAGTPMLIATPVAPLPAEVAAAVRSAFAAEAIVRSGRLFLVDQTGAGPQPLVLVELDPGVDGEAVDTAMGRVIEAVTAHTDQAGGLTFGLVTDEWRATYESGGIALYDR